MELKIVHCGNKIRRNIAEYVLNCTEEELFEINNLLEDAEYKFVFSCNDCNEKYGNCNVDNEPNVCFERFISENEDDR